MDKKEAAKIIKDLSMDLSSIESNAHDILSDIANIKDELEYLKIFFERD